MVPFPVVIVRAIWEGYDFQSYRLGACADLGFSRWGPRVKLESRECRAVTVFTWVEYDSALDRIFMNVVSMVHEILVIANPVIGESSLPDFSFAAEDGPEGMRIATFDQLDRVLKRYFV